MTISDHIDCVIWTVLAVVVIFVAKAIGIMATMILVALVVLVIGALVFLYALLNR